MRRLVPVLLLVLLAAPVGSARETKNQAGYLRLVHLTDGLRSASPKQDLRRLTQSTIYKTAQRAGLDLKDPPHSLIAHSYNDHRLFYVFYKVLEGIVSDRPYVIQRIKKTVRNWSSPDEPPEETVTYQVETFKTLAGTIKRPDQHYGSFGLRELHKREIVKEYEIGIGTIAGDAEGLSWPYDAGTLYILNQPYQAEVGVYDDVRFETSLTWSLSVAFDREGYRIQAPELGVDAPAKLPADECAHVHPNEKTSKTVLEAGKAGGQEIGEAEADALSALGRTRRVDRYDNGAAYHQLDSEITAFTDKEGKLRTIMTHAAFAGRTKRGIRHGSHRADVMKAYGVPHNQRTDAPRWSYPGIRFAFDGYHRVSRITLFKLPAK